MAEEVKFRESKPGYDKEEVDEYVRILSEAYNELYTNKGHTAEDIINYVPGEKSLEEINNDFNKDIEQLALYKPRTNKSIAGKIAENIFLGFALFFLLFVFATQINGEKDLFGYHFFHILTGSMQDVYPKGAMVLVKNVDKKDIEIGNDITFLVDESTFVTHRVIDIVEDFDNDGHIGFKTQGVNNLNPDKDITHEWNVVGVVVVCIPVVGSVINYISRNIKFIGFVTLVFVVFIYSCRVFWREKNKQYEKGGFFENGRK